MCDCDEDLIKFLEDVSEQHPEIQKWSLCLNFNSSVNCVDNFKKIVKITAEKLELLSFERSVQSQVTNSMLVELINATGGQLAHLILNYNDISGEELSVESEKLKKLQSLDLFYCTSLTDAGLSKLINSTGGQLVELCLGGTEITKINVEKDKLEQLQSLELPWCRSLTNEGLSKLINSSGGKIVKLNLGNTNITNINVEKDRLKQLQSLSLFNCLGLINEKLLQLLNLTGGDLVTLHLEETEISGQLFDLAKPNLKNLQKLILSDCHELTNEGLTTILNLTGGHLVELDLSKTNVSGEQLNFEDGKLKQLECLNLCDTKKLTKKGLSQLLNSTGGNLIELNLGSAYITGEPLNVEESTLKNLQHLDIHNCRNLTNAGIENIISLTGGQLKNLALGCNYKSGLLNLNQEKLKRLQSLKLSYSIFLQEGFESLINSTGGELVTLRLEKVMKKDNNIPNDKDQNKSHKVAVQLNVGDKLEKLQNLEIYGEGLTKEMLAAIVNSTGGQLEYLEFVGIYSLSGFDISTEEDLVRIGIHRSLLRNVKIDI